MSLWKLCVLLRLSLAIGLGLLALVGLQGLGLGGFGFWGRAQVDKVQGLYKEPVSKKVNLGSR